MSNIFHKMLRHNCSTWARFCGRFLTQAKYTDLALVLAVLAQQSCRNVQQKEELPTYLQLAFGQLNPFSFVLVSFSSSQHFFLSNVNYNFKLNAFYPISYTNKFVQYLVLNCDCQNMLAHFKRYNTGTRSTFR